MQRQRSELVPIGDAVSELDVPVPTIRDASPQARHHFTQADQVNQLVAASEATPDLGFIARMMALCSLPRTNPGNRHQYKRVNGPFTLYMERGRWWQAPLRQLPAPDPRMDLYRSHENPKPGACSGPLSFRVHAVTRNQQRQRWGSWGANPAPQPDEPALWLHRFTDLRG